MMSSKNFNRAAYPAIFLAALLGLQACNSGGTKSDTKNVLNLGGENQTAEEPKEFVADPRAFCPKTIIRTGTETYRTFTSGVKKDDVGALNHLEYQATINEAVRECNYTPDNLNIRVGVRGRVINGPTGATGTLVTPIRIAVVNTDREVLFSELHQVSTTIPDGGSFARFSLIEGSINLPVPKVANLLIYVGFDEGPPS